jgi:hypothetical protein
MMLDNRTPGFSPRVELTVGGVMLIGPEPVAQSKRGEVWRGLSVMGESAPRLVACTLTRPWVVADESARQSLLHRAAVRAALLCDAAPRHLGAWEFDAGDGVGIAVIDEYGGDLRFFDVARLLAGPAGPGGRLPVEIALHVAWQVGRLHRAARALGPEVELTSDPNDVLLDWDGRVRVVVNTRPPPGAAAAASDFAYLAPERLRSREGKGGESWSIGVQLYELLTGRHPFRKMGALETMSAILNEPVPPLASLRPDLHPSLAALVDRCLLRDPKARPRLVPLVDALGGALERARARPAAVLAGLLSRAFAERRAESLALRSQIVALRVESLLTEVPALAARRIASTSSAFDPPSFDDGGHALVPAADPDAGPTVVEPDLDIEGITVSIDLDAETVVLSPDLDGETTAVGDLEAETVALDGVDARALMMTAPSE